MTRIRLRTHPSAHRATRARALDGETRAALLRLLIASLIAAGLVLLAAWDARAGSPRGPSAASAARRLRAVAPASAQWIETTCRQTDARTKETDPCDPRRNRRERLRGARTLPPRREPHAPDAASPLSHRRRTGQHL